MNKQLKEDISCYFNLESNEPRIFSGDKSFEEMQVMLKEQGIELTILPDAKVLYLKFDHEKYNRTKTRHAGQQRKYAYKNEKKYEINAYKYYDILYFRFCKHWTWTKIADYIELSEATFFRHKKEMESSSEYKKFLESFDASDAESREYFKNFEELNYMFQKHNRKDKSQQLPSFPELLDKDPKESKRIATENQKKFGDIIGFELDGVKYPTKPETAFYDWIYITALRQNKELADYLLQFDGFTDIQFNPKRSINCQAKSAAYYVALVKTGQIDNVKTFKDMVKILYQYHRTT